MSTKIYQHSIELFDTLHRAPVLLNSEARNSIAGFISGQFTPGGGFANRAGVCDQYYTMFGLACAATLNIPLPLVHIKRYLNNCPPETLDLVHLVCLEKSLLLVKMLRCKSFYPLFRLVFRWKLFPPPKIEFDKYRAADGGFADNITVDRSNPYSIFMGVNLYQDCGKKIPDITGAVAALESCRTKEGVFHNPDGGQEMLLSTAAAMLSLRQLTGKIERQTLDWLVQQQGSTGGFHASPNTQMPDLLSTAVALFTLRICGYPIEPLAGPAKEFILDHWHENGGFTGTLVDDCADCEYTFYALMALGALAE